MSTIHYVNARRPVKQQRAGQLINALEVLGGAEAMKLRDAILAQLKVIEDVASGATGASSEATLRKRESASADKAFRTGLDGTVAMAVLANPDLEAKLPSRESYAGVDDDAYAEVVIKGLEDAGEKKLAAVIQKAKERRLNLAREAQKASQTTAGGQTHSAKTELAQLVMLISQAEVLIHRMAPPGSPVLDLIKHPARGGKNNKGKGAHAKKPAAQGDASSASNGQPAPVATPAPTSPNVNGAASAPAVNIVVPAGAAALANGVHA